MTPEEAFRAIEDLEARGIVPSEVLFPPNRPLTEADVEGLARLVDGMEGP
jgi:hypothetical protein